MSAPVDVLAVLSDYSAQHGNPEDFERAIVAVAELIKYGIRIEQRRRGVLWGGADAEAQDWAEFRSALARCTGGAA